MVELDYIKSHFPQFITDLIPKILIVMIILQVIFGLIRFSVRNSETGKAEQVKSGLKTASLILWVMIIALIGIDCYYYFMYIRQ